MPFTVPKIISVTKGTYGQYIITAEVKGEFYSKQYYGYTKKDARATANAELKEGTFSRI